MSAMTLSGPLLFLMYSVKRWIISLKPAAYVMTFRGVACLPRADLNFLQRGPFLRKYYTPYKVTWPFPVRYKARYQDNTNASMIFKEYVYNYSSKYLRANFLKKMAKISLLQESCYHHNFSSPAPPYIKVATYYYALCRATAPRMDICCVAGPSSCKYL